MRFSRMIAPVFMLTVAMFAAAVFSFGQTPAAPSAVDTAIQLVQAKLPDNLIIKQLQTLGNIPKLSTADLVKLKNAGASDALVAFMMDPAAPAPAQTPPGTTAVAADAAAKKPGVKRVCVYSTGTAGNTASGHLLSMLGSDPTLLDAKSLSQKVDAMRQAEAQRNQCDFVFEASFDAKPKSSGGSVFDKAIKAASNINKESTTFGNKQSTQTAIDKKNASAANLSKELAPEPKDKVKIAYKLFPGTSRTATVMGEKEVLGSDLEKYLDGMINEVVNAILK